MIRYYASVHSVPTTEGALPSALYIAGDTSVHGWELNPGPLRCVQMNAPLWRLMVDTEHKEARLHECSLSTYTEWRHLWDAAIQTAKTPPAKIAKLGEVWELTGGELTMLCGMYYVTTHSEYVPIVMRHMTTGACSVGSAGAPVTAGIQLKSPGDWTCHGLLTDLITKGKA